MFEVQCVSVSSCCQAAMFEQKSPCLIIMSQFTLNFEFEFECELMHVNLYSKFSNLTCSLG